MRAPVGFFCEQGGHDAQGGNFPLHAYDVEFLFSKNLEDVFHAYLSSGPGEGCSYDGGGRTGAAVTGEES